MSKLLLSKHKTCLVVKDFRQNKTYTTMEYVQYVCCTVSPLTSPLYTSAMWLSSSGYCTVIMFVFSEEVRVLQAKVHKKLSNVHVTIWMSLGRRSPPPPPPPLRCWQAPFCSVWSDFWTLVSEIDAGSLSKWCGVRLFSCLWAVLQKRSQHFWYWILITIGVLKIWPKNRER